MSDDDNWYDDRVNLAAVARRMGQQGDGVDDVAYMLEKPWKFEDEWLAALQEAIESDLLARGYALTGQLRLARKRALHVIRGGAA